MDANEISRRLEEARRRIREQLADSPPPSVAAAAPADPALELEDTEDARTLAGDPNLNSTPHLEAANRLEAIAAPVDLSSDKPVIGPILTLLRRLARPIVRPLIDPYLARQELFNAEIVRHLNELGQRLEVRMNRITDDLRHWASDPSLLEARLEASLASYDNALRQRHTVLFDALEQELWSLQNLVQDGAGTAPGRLQEFEVRFVERAQAVDRRFDEKDRAVEEMLKAQMATGGAGASEAGLQATRAALQRTLREVTAVREALGRSAEGVSGDEIDRWARLRDWLDDDDYQAFQDKFRGEESEILERMRGHVAHFAGVTGPVADLGCGRGEFLELLEAAGLDAIGVEINTADVESCAERGLRAVEADLFEWLAEQESETLGGIFLAQVIEHLPPVEWSRFLALASTRLQPGGVLLIETINPESLYALARAYVIDPTHTRPAHPELIAFLAGRNGFAEVRIHLQADVPDEQRMIRLEEESYRSDEMALELVRSLNDRLARLDRAVFAPQEYALVARKAAGD